MEPLTIAYLLIALGVLALVAESFAATGGLLALAAAVMLLGGLILAFAVGGVSAGTYTLAALFGATPLGVALFLFLWPRVGVGRLQVKPPAGVVVADSDRLVGRYGRAVSDLRPSGVAEFDGRRVDVLTEGMPVAAGSWVRCVEARPGRVVVRAADAPDLHTLEDTDFLT